MKNPPKKPGGGKPPRPSLMSPLYTSKAQELTKRTVIADKGRDTDGAYRASGRKDAN